ncbi:MAG TPA: hypothetical protein VK824_09720 [Planctomycetota bacterium]|nr:hypothetical protein [Planctomycetota bacterium]
MRQLTHAVAAVLLAAGVAGLASPPAHAQDKPAPQPGGAGPGGAGPGGSGPGVGGPAGLDEAEGGAGAAEALVKRIQSSLGEVDAALQQASEGETAAAGVESAKRKHLEVIRDIDALIKQIKYQQSRNPSGGGGGGGKPSEDPLSGKSPPQPSDGSQAPKPGGKPGTQPEPQSGQDEQQGRKPAGSQPKDGTPGANEEGGRLPPDATGKYTRTDMDARWGLLPPKLQERLMNLHVDDVPERYRAWLDAYIHALNSREQEGRTR